MWPPTNAPKRGKVDIISTMLVIAGEGGIAKTHLMYRSNLDSRALKKHIALVTEKGFLSSERDGDNHETYHLTEKGRDFLQRYKGLEGLLV